MFPSRSQAPRQLLILPYGWSATDAINWLRKCIASSLLRASSQGLWGARWRLGGAGSLLGPAVALKITVHLVSTKKQKSSTTRTAVPGAEVNNAKRGDAQSSRKAEGTCRYCSRPTYST